LKSQRVGFVLVAEFFQTENFFNLGGKCSNLEFEESGDFS